MSMNSSEFLLTKMNEHEILNATFVHPFTCIIAGPSGCGKTTFVKELITHRKSLISGELKYVLIYIGTLLNENPIFEELQKEHPGLVRVISVNQLYENDPKLFEAKFARDFNETIRTLGQGGCVIFDDMMSQLARAAILSDLYSKISSHQNMSVINITQNLFTKSKQAQEHRTVYTSCHHLVLFKQPMDSSIFEIIARRVHASCSYKDVYRMLVWAADKFRYVMVSGGWRRSEKLKYTTDLFNVDPVPFQRVFLPLKNGNKV